MVITMVPHWIDGEERPPAEPTGTFEKVDPATGQVQSVAARGGAAEVEAAVQAAARALPGWMGTPAINRSDIIRQMALLLMRDKEEFAEIVAAETGKSKKDARGEVGAAIEQGFFIAGEGRRFYGRTTTSGVPHRTAKTVRQPIGVCGLIIPANTPIANIAWKTFPALVCGNTVVLKPPEDCPQLAQRFARLTKEAGVPAGVFNVVQGLGTEAGMALVRHPQIDLVSFTGSVAAGKRINETAAGRLARVILELGGKNALVVCDDADLERAVEASVLSAFSNAGQRCASGSRIVVFEKVYADFRKLLLDRIATLKVGCSDEDDYGPVINERQLNNMLGCLKKAQAKILTGGQRLDRPGFFLAPTVIEGAGEESELSTEELFGPITCLYPVKDFEDAVRLVNRSPFGLTAAIHTRSVHRAELFQQRVRTGVVSVNGPTYGSEPHLPFGGLGLSGNGWREAGTEALDAYSEWKTIYVVHDPGAV